MLRPVFLLLFFTTFATFVFCSPLEDTCECECCPLVDGYRECVQKSATTFSTHTCASCNVTMCARFFPRSCGVAGASIATECIERTAWYLRFIPVLFVVATVALLFYGLFIKTFDGYHPIQDTDTDSPTASLSRTFSAAPYHSVEQTPFEPRNAYAVRRPSPLSQTAPLASDRSPRRTSSPSVMSRMSPLAAVPLAPLTAGSTVPPIGSMVPPPGTTVMVTEPTSPVQTARTSATVEVVPQDVKVGKSKSGSVTSKKQ